MQSHKKAESIINAIKLKKKTTQSDIKLCYKLNKT